MNKLLAVLLASSFTLSAFGDNPVKPGAPKSIEGQPAMYFGVKSCGKTVMWVLLTNGRFFRIDDEHTPPDKEAFIKQLSGVNGDLVEIPCPDIL
jgi:hypothetical protein